MSAGVGCTICDAQRPGDSRLPEHETHGRLVRGTLALNDAGEWVEQWTEEQYPATMEVGNGPQGEGAEGRESE